MTPLREHDTIRYDSTSYMPRIWHPYDDVNTFPYIFPPFLSLMFVADVSGEERQVAAQREGDRAAAGRAGLAGHGPGVRRVPPQPPQQGAVPWLSMRFPALRAGAVPTSPPPSFLSLSLSLSLPTSLPPSFPRWPRPPVSCSARTQYLRQDFGTDQEVMVKMQHFAMAAQVICTLSRPPICTLLGPLSAPYLCPI